MNVSASLRLGGQSNKLVLRDLNPEDERLYLLAGQFVAYVALRSHIVFPVGSCESRLCGWRQY